MIFSLTEKAMSSLFSEKGPGPFHFAYVEWFTPFPAEPDATTKMYRIKRLKVDGERVASVIPVEEIRRSVHLIPRFGKNLNPSWTSANVLEVCEEFYVNGFSDRHAYITMK
jgi:hypothetical protein